MPLAGRRILLGISGGIAAYKMTWVVRLLKKAGADVRVVLTPDAERFVTPLTLGTLSEHEVLSTLWPEQAEGSWTKHVHLGLWPDLMVVAPATAQTLAKMAHGMCDNLLTAVLLSARCPVLACPAMDHDMYLHPATQANLALLRSRGVHVMEPGTGPLASGLVGEGRLREPEEIVAEITRLLTPKQSLAGQHVLVTAGPTREHLDPVRFISNPSTGTMGFALAAEAARRGATVTLVAGPTTLATPPGVSRKDVVSAREMLEAVLPHAKTADWVFMAAAVSDYAPADVAEHKRKKQDGPETLTFVRTPDILATLGANKSVGQRLVGFAMETEHGEAHAMDKLARKNLDAIVLNLLNEPGAGFGTGTNRVTLLRPAIPPVSSGTAPKDAVAGWILDHLLPSETTSAEETAR